MKPTTPKDPNQGEGDRASARHYNERARRFVAEGKVPDAARTAKVYIESKPTEAARAERTARKGPHRSNVSVDELVAAGRGVVDRVRPVVKRAVARIKSRIDRISPRTRTKS